VTDCAAALKLYETAVTAGEPEDIRAAAAVLAEAAEHLSGADHIRVTALGLHLRTVGALNAPDCSEIDRYRGQIETLAATSMDPAVGAIRAIVTFCSYYVDNDRSRLSEALRLFAVPRGDSGILALERAARINEVRTHTLSLNHGASGPSPDRVEELVGELDAIALSPRLASILVFTLGDFYGRLALRYGDPGFLHQGIDLIEPRARETNVPAVSEAALGAIMALIAKGLEFDEYFRAPRDLLRMAQRRVRLCRDESTPPNHSVAEMAHCLGLRARFDWERGRRRTGVLRALGWLRIAARTATYSSFYSTTLRVAYEAGLGDDYLYQSLENFEANRHARGGRVDPPDNANYASTLMLLGKVEQDPARFKRAMELYECAIGAEPDAGTNVARYINLASSALSYARLLSANEGAEAAHEQATDALLRGLDALLMADVVDRPGSTHEALRRQVGQNYHGLLEAQLGPRHAHEAVLHRATELFAADPDRWPVGVVRAISDRIVQATDIDEIDDDLALICANLLLGPKTLLQLLDLCNARGEMSPVISALFAAAIRMFGVLDRAGRTAEALSILDRLTSGFVGALIEAPPETIDARAAAIVRRAVAGAPLSAADAGLVRRTTAASVVAIPPSPGDPADGARLDIIASGGVCLAIARGNDRLLSRTLPPIPDDSEAAMVPLLDGLGELAQAVADAGAIWLSFRNVAPAIAHRLFEALRLRVEALPAPLALYRQASRGLSGVPMARSWSIDGAPPRFLIVHSPRNAAPSLHFGFQFADHARRLGADVVELALDDCRRDRIEAELKRVDALFIVSHGERGDSAQPDRILLSANDYADAAWLLTLGNILSNKLVFLVACNSAHFNAHLAHDDVSLGPLAISLGCKGAFSTLRAVDELSILLFLTEAIRSWRDGDPLHAALDRSRRHARTLDAEGWAEAHAAFVGGGMAARAAYRAPLGSANEKASWAPTDDVQHGWSYIQR
jgi:hypothetical protein